MEKLHPDAQVSLGATDEVLTKPGSDRLAVGFCAFLVPQNHLMFPHSCSVGIVVVVSGELGLGDEGAGGGGVGRARGEKAARE